MGNISSSSKKNNNNDVETSPIDTLNWNGYLDPPKLIDVDIVDIDIPMLSDSENNTESINNLESNIDINELNSSKKYNINKSYSDDDTSPFISTEIYEKIMKGGGEDLLESLDDSSSSDIDDSDDSTSDLKLSKEDEEYVKSDIVKNKKAYVLHPPTVSVSPTSSMKGSGNESANGYGFSETSSEFIQTSEFSEKPVKNKSQKSSHLGKKTKNNKKKNNLQSSESPYKLSSSTINTSDVNLVSVNSRKGRRYI